MQICPNCGRALPDGAVCLCKSVPPTETQGLENPALAVIRGFGASGKFLAAAIFLSLSAVSWLLAIPLFRILLFESTSEFLTGPDMVAVNVFTALFSGIAFFFFLAAAVVWVHYGLCRRKGAFSTVTLTIWKVKYYISLILTCVFGGLFLLIIPIVLLTGNLSTAAEQAFRSSAERSMVTALFIFEEFLFAAMMVLPILFDICMIKIINRAKKMIATGVPNEKVSRFPIVLRYIQGGYGAFSGGMWAIMLVMMSFTLPLAAQTSPETAIAPLRAMLGAFGAFGLAMLFFAIYLILTAVCMSQYRQQLIRLVTPPVPMYYYGALPQYMPMQQAVPMARPVAPSAPISQDFSAQPDSVSLMQETVHSLETITPVPPETGAGVVSKDNTEE